MLKKNKLTIFLLLVVVVLTVYYVKMPINTTEPAGTTPSVSARYPLNAQTRLEVITSRNELISSYEEQLANTTYSSEMAVFLENVNELEELTLREIRVENQIKDTGYEDCLVYATDNQIKVNVLTNSFSVEEFIEVALLIKGEFGDDCNVVVNVNNPV